jgi:hypothetical protein
VSEGAIARTLDATSDEEIELTSLKPPRVNEGERRITNDLRIMSSPPSADNKENQSVSAEDYGNLRQNPQTGSK